GAIILPRMFADDFGDDITRVVSLVDLGNNRFQCLAEKINQNVYLTRGWGAIQDFYDIRFGAWIMLLYKGAGEFGIVLQDRFHRPIQPRQFFPPMQFIIDMCRIPDYFVDNLPESIELLSYAHNRSFFTLAHDKSLTLSDVTEGYLYVPYDNFGEHVFDEDITFIKLVDDCGCAWACDVTYHATNPRHFRVAGQWSRLVAARRLLVDETIKIGSQANGLSNTIYLMFTK
ncbi:ATP-dependent DNA helicase PIF1, partial [Trifolium medium]|nr:ATP-dependent DNA helicase PIF1 [Trifolium medium]